MQLVSATLQCCLQARCGSRIDHPRYPITPSFGRELASLSFECKHLGEAADLPWYTKPHSASSDAELLATSAEERALAKFALLLSQTWPGRMIIRSQLLKVIGKRLLKRTTNTSVA